MMGPVPQCLSRFTVAAVGPVAAILLSGCDLLSQTDHFVIRVSSIDAPSVIGPADTLKVRFIRHIGPDGCSSLYWVERHRQPASLEMKFHGAHDTDGDCTQMPTDINYREDIVPPVPIPFTIIVHQPDGSVLGRVVTR